MTLRSKALLAIGATGLLSIALLYAVSMSVLLHGLSQAETRKAEQSVKSAQNAISNWVYDLDQTAADWSSWDDTDQFIQDGNATYIDRNLSIEGLSNISLNFIIFVDMNRKVYFSKGIDLRNETEVAVPQALLRFVEAEPRFNFHDNKESHQSGIIALPGILAIAASRPIMNSVQTGPIRGALIIGRYLDSVHSTRIADLTQESISVYSLEDPVAQNLLQQHPEFAAGSQQTVLRTLDKQTLLVYATMSDIYQNPCLMLEIRERRDIYLQGKRSLQLLMISLIAVAATMGVTGVVIVDKFVVGPVDRLGKCVSSIAVGTDLTTRVPVLGRDELSVLSATINGMLNALDKHVHALRASEERYKTFFENSADAMLIIRGDTFVDCNAAAVKLLGYQSKDQLSNRRPAELSPEFQPNGRRSTDEEVVKMREAREKGSATFEWNHKRKSGDIVPVEVSLTAIPRENEIILHTIWRDISQRKAVEQERERLIQGIAQATEAVVITDAAGLIQYVNPAFERITGFASEEANGFSLKQVQHAERDDAFEELWAALCRGEPWLGRIECKRKNADLYTAEQTISPVRDAAGHVVSIVTVIRDVTKEVQLERDLRQAQKMEAVGQLAGGIAHDFNNLLQAILGYSELGLDAAGPDSPVREPIHEILKASHRAKGLVSQLLAFSRRQILDMKNIDLNKLIAEFISMIRRVIGEHIELVVSPDPNIGIVRADSGQIEQILINLCINARDAMPNGGKISIRTENVSVDADFIKDHPWATSGRYAAVIVSDTGCGMDEATLANVFEPFFTTKGVGEGTGLGLATVYGLVKQHNGIVLVSSEVGVGTTFEVYLPVTAAIHRDVANASQPPVCGGSETVLLAEDDEGVRVLTKRMLESAGYRVLAAEDGEDALRIFAESNQSIDMAMLDVIMPKLGGRAVYDRIREQTPDFRVLFTSGYNLDAIHTNFVLEEGVCLIQKPFQREALLTAVRATLDRK